MSRIDIYEIYRTRRLSQVKHLLAIWHASSKVKQQILGESCWKLTYASELAPTTHVTTSGQHITFKALRLFFGSKRLGLCEPIISLGLSYLIHKVCHFSSAYIDWRPRSIH